MLKATDPQAGPCRFATQRAFESWLRKNHASSNGVWLLIAKAGEREAAPPRASVGERVKELMLSEQLDEKTALKRVAKEMGLGKSEAYRELQRSKK